MIYLAWLIVLAVFLMLCYTVGDRFKINPLGGQSLKTIKTTRTEQLATGTIRILQAFVYCGAMVALSLLFISAIVYIAQYYMGIL